MALKFSLNKAQISTISQVLLAMPSGKVYDHKAQEITGVVTLAAEHEADAAQLRKQELSGFKVVTEA